MMVKGECNKKYVCNEIIKQSNSNYVREDC